MKKLITFSVRTQKLAYELDLSPVPPLKGGGTGRDRFRTVQNRWSKVSKGTGLGQVGTGYVA